MTCYLSEAALTIMRALGPTATNTGVRITTGPRARGPKNGGGAPRFSG